MNIRKIITASGLSVVAVLAVAVVATLAPTSAHAEDKQEPADSSVSYAYVAQPGDSYSLMARKAVQTYGKKYDVNLSQGQILFAETNLTMEAGSPQLNEGQSVTLAESKVKAWVEKAKALSGDVVAGWSVYAVGVDFNTDRVGEKRQ